MNPFHCDASKPLTATSIGDNGPITHYPRHAGGSIKGSEDEMLGTDEPGACGPRHQFSRSIAGARGGQWTVDAPRIGNPGVDRFDEELDRVRRATESGPARRVAGAGFGGEAGFVGGGAAAEEAFAESLDGAVFAAAGAEAAGVLLGDYVMAAAGDVAGDGSAEMEELTDCSGFGNFIWVRHSRASAKRGPGEIPICSRAS